jgi:hypothetical protein
VHADVTTMNGPHPVITVVAEVLPNSEVWIDGKAIALNGDGVGSYSIDERASAEGPADESRIVSVDVPYRVSVRGGPPQSGTVSARVAVAPLRVDAPGARTVVDDDRVLVAGRAAKNAGVTVDGAPVPVAGDGSFETTVPIAAIGERVVDVRGGTTTLMPRTVHVNIRRVANLADAARAFEATGPIGYDAAMHDLPGNTGRPIVVEGEVFESRQAGHRTLFLVDDRRGCAKGPCLVRVVMGRDVSLGRGEVIDAYGTVVGPFSPSAGRSVPDVEADFLVRAKH